jgi:Xaa-Pro aminopeptidase
MNYLQIRRTNVLNKLKADGLEGLLVTGASNVEYLTGFAGGDSYFVLTAKNAVLVSDTRYEEQIKEECPDLMGEAVIRSHDRTTPEATAELLNKLAVKPLGFEAAHLSVELRDLIAEKATKTTLVPTHGKVEGFRAIKDASEVAKIREAISVAERAFGMFTAMLRDTDTEKDMVDAMEAYLRRAGARRASFPPICAVGERGALPHAPPTSRQLGEGSKLLVDWGADVGYKCDITRVFRSPFPTPPTRKNKQERVGLNFEAIYKAVQVSQEAAVGVLRAGTSVKDVDTAARKALTKARIDHLDGDLAEYFTHGLGHGLGLDTHELPRIRQNSDDMLEVGMVVTLEPGVYIPGWGGVRLEDDFLIGKDGPIRLTTLPHDPSVIG